VRLGPGLDVPQLAASTLPPGGGSRPPGDPSYTSSPPKVSHRVATRTNVTVRPRLALWQEWEQWHEGHLERLETANEKRRGKQQKELVDNPSKWEKYPDPEASPFFVPLPPSPLPRPASSRRPSPPP
jgi:hypothetical protein